MAANVSAAQAFKAPPSFNINTINNPSSNSNGLLNLNTNLTMTNTILIAKFDYESKESHELNLKKNERLILIDNSKNWWLVKKQDTNQTGYAFIIQFTIVDIFGQRSYIILKLYFRKLIIRQLVGLKNFTCNFSRFQFDCKINYLLIYITK